MKLKEFHIKNYKNLKDITIDFESGNGLTMLIGNNGSGKSNVLEAISGIFHDAYKDNKQRKLASHGVEYDLRYTISDHEILIRRKNDTLRFYVDGHQKERDVFTRNYMPKNVIGMYSGEEDRLWTSYYEPYYKAYIRNLKFGGHISPMKLMFINKNYWNIALLTLLLSKNPTLDPFIKDEIQINTVDQITINYSFNQYRRCDNALLKAFIDRINPNHDSMRHYSLEELRELLFSDTALADENDNRIVFGDDTGIIVESGLTDRDVFDNIMQAYMPDKEKLISCIEIKFNGGITTDQLSEGEKKLILVKAVLEILSDEKTLLLFDEPDANLHEGRKQELYNLFSEYRKYDRQMIIATHSPIIAQLAADEELLMMDTEAGEAVIFSDEKKNKIKRLLGTSWDIIGQAMILKSNKPLVVFEGKTDVMYVKRALELLKTTKPQYKSISVDFLNANGAGNVKSFIDNLKEFIPVEKKIVVFFDRDDGGKKGAAALTGFSKDSEEIVHYNDIEQGSLIVSFIPYKEDATGDFLIEDYFSWDKTIKPMVDKLIESKHYPLKNLPSLASQVKTDIEKMYLDFSKEEFEGFSVLLDKILSISGS